MVNYLISLARIIKWNVLVNLWIQGTSAIEQGIQ